jgi:hypothetical protein
VQPVTREFSALGSKVVESNVPFKGPEDEPDFWEGNQFEVSPAAARSQHNCIQWQFEPANTSTSSCL